jgi:cytoskeletal protein RodZ
MLETVGKRLSQARLKRGLSIDEAAHATKLRPDKIVALENDDYARFPSNSYAKGFLLIYGRFLRVDVSESARALQEGNPISVADYQYLNNAPEPKPETYTVRRDRQRKPPSIVPVLIFGGIVVLAFFGFQAYVNWQRITGVVPGHHTPATASKTPASPAPSGVATPPEVPPVALPPSGADANPPEFAQPNVEPVAPPPGPTAIAERPNAPQPSPVTTPGAPAPAANPDQAFLVHGDMPVVRAVPVEPDRDTVTPAAVVVNEVEIGAQKKTWVTVRMDDPASKPVFEDYIYPSARPLKLKGSRFYIEARDPASVKILKNGAPIAYQAPGVTIQ